MAGTQCPYNGSQTGGDASPNYGPNSTKAALVEPSTFAEPALRLDGEADRYSRYNQDDFTQAGNLYRIFPEDEKARLIATICGSLSQTTMDVQQTMVEHFTKADADYGQRIKQALGL